MAAVSASQRCAADSVSVSSTVCRSKVERLITLSTSAVAVCCCRDSRSSLSRRVFSMAMTAWLAKFWTSSIFLAVNTDHADQLVFLKQRDYDEGAGTPEVGKSSGVWVALEVRLGHSQIIDVHHLSGSRDPAERAAWGGTDHRAPPRLCVCSRDVVQSDISVRLTVIEVQGAEFCAAEPNRVREHGLEHRLQVAGRARYYLQ